ncbi:MAG: flagellin lysine-N-methylase [Huintestinicola sp.]|uniref:flagellin lysine-N-methylase n=1 Tax=Huintestinicola sp. TaxID=2981661 RepID=UPI003F0CB038
MDIYVPDYYENFRCIGGTCHDSCCIGWEIDIDKASLEKYMKFPGALGDELRANITRSEDGSDCFALGENDRCPFLNENNLCRLIIAGGEEMLCEICSLHPRFREWFGDRCEMGIGLCCEEAARIIIGYDKPFGLHKIGSEEGGEALSPAEKRLLEIRAELFKAINEAESYAGMTEALLRISAQAESELTGNSPARITFPRDSAYAEKAVSLITSLEPINAGWEHLCQKLSPINIIPENKALAGYKDLLSYYIFRYFMRSASDGEIFLKTALGVFSAEAVSLIMSISGQSLADSACLWSKETEYSLENLELIYDFLYELYYT